MVRTSVLGIGVAVALAIAAGAFLLFETTTSSSMTSGGSALRSVCSHEAWDAWWAAPRPAPDAQYTLEVRDGERVEIVVPAGDHYTEIESSGTALHAPRHAGGCSTEPEIKVFYAEGSGTATVTIWSIPGQ